MDVVLYARWPRLMVVLLMLASAALCCCQMKGGTRAEVATVPAAHACCNLPADDSAPPSKKHQHCFRCDQTNGLAADRNSATPSAVLAPTEPLAFVDHWVDAGRVLVTGRRVCLPDATAPPRASTPVELHVLILS